MKYLYVLFIFLQIVIIIYLFSHIKNKTNTLGVSINVKKLNSNKYIFKSTSKLKYFYEPVPMSIEYPPTEVSWFKPDMGIKINSDSLNNVEVNTDNTYINIIALGDSFTYGQFVKRENNWVSKLEKKIKQNILEKMQIINLGVKGYDIEYAVERFRIRGIKYHPKTVFWLVKGEDFGSIAELLTPLAHEEERKLEGYSNPDDKYVNKKSDGGPEYIKNAVKRMLKIVGDDTQKLLEYQKSKILDLRKYFKGNIVFVCLQPNDEFMNILFDLKKNDSNIYIFKIPEIYSHADNYFPDLHPTEKGYEIIAHSIYEYILNNKFLLR